MSSSQSKNVRFNDDQIKAINSEKKTIVVSAGAGSGKTQVLKQRIIRKLNSGESLNNLLIITFTKASAKEMRDRLLSSVSELDTPLSNQEIAESKIMTFDAFFLNFVKKFGYIIGIDTDISVADQMILDYKTCQIIKKVVLEASEVTKKQLFLTFNFDINQVTKELLKVYNTVSGENLIETYGDYAKEDFIREAQIKYLEILKAKLVTLAQGVNATDVLVALEDENFTYENLEEVVAYLNKVTKEYVKENDAKDQIDNLKAEIKFKDFFSPSKLVGSSDYQRLWENIRVTNKIIAEVLLEIDKRVYDYKKSINSFTYNDIAKMVLEICKSDNQDVKTYLEEIHEIMVDEFQDTNPLQNLIIENIRQKNTSLFVVGDPKQSIYGFRRSTPEFFNSLARECAQKEDSELIKLNQNYRSQPGVLNDINEIFMKKMTLSRGEVDYKKDHVIKPGREESKESDVFLRQYTVGEHKMSNDEYAFVDAYLCLKNISKRVTAGEIKPSDVYILAAKKKQFAYLRKIASYFNLPINIQESHNHVDSEIFGVYFAILKLLQNKDDKTALMVLLRSYLYEADDNDIHELINNGSGNLLNLKIEIHEKLEQIWYMANSHNVEFTLNYIFQVFGLVENIGRLDKVKKSNDLIKNIKRINSIFDAHNINFYEALNIYIELVNQEELALTLPYQEDEESISAMTIHNSKGLEESEIHILISPPNASAGNNVSFSREYGLGLRGFFAQEVDPDKIYEVRNPIKVLNGQLENEKDYHELIRLYYVALTRAQKDVYIYINDNSKNKMVHDYFLGFNKTKMIDLKEYEEELRQIYFSKSKSEQTENSSEREYPSSRALVELSVNPISRASRDDVSLLKEKEISNQLYGDYLHQKLSFIDFSNIDSQIQNYKSDSDLDFASILENIKENPLFANVKSSFKEIEFYDENQNIHGFIDLILEKETDELILIDYKLSDIDKLEYDRQLKIYKKYIQRVYPDRDVKAYLYSLKKNESREIS